MARVPVFFIKCSLALILGALAGQWVFDIQYLFVFQFLFGGGSLLLIFLTNSTYSKRILLVFSSTLFLILSGAILLKKQSISHTIHEGNDIRLVEIVKVKPSKNGKGITAKIKFSKSQKQSSKSTLLYFYSKSTTENFYYGDQLWIKGTFKNVSNKQSYLNSFEHYLYSQGVSQTAFSYQLKFIKHGTFYPILVRITQSQEVIKSRIDAVISGKKVRDLLYALILGQKSFMDYEMKLNFTKVGIVHVLAVSGLHVYLIYQIFAFAFLPFKIKIRWLHFTLIIVGIWSYTFISGLSISTVRAAIMCSIMIISELSGRKGHSYSTLFFTASLILILDIKQIYDIGFQLSFSAVAGLIFIASPLNRKLNFENPIFKFFSTLLIASFAAQLGTLPVILFHFNQLPVYSSIANVIAIPFISLVLGISFLILLPIPYLSDWLAKILEAGFNLFEWLLTQLTHLPYNQIRFANHDLISLSILSLVIFFFVVLLNYKSKLSIYALLISCILYWSYQHYTIVKRNHSGVIMSSETSLNATLAWISTPQNLYIYYIGDPSHVRFDQILNNFKKNYSTTKIITSNHVSKN